MNTKVPIIDKSTWFYENCKRQRKNNAKICQECPFRKSIEEQEGIAFTIACSSCGMINVIDDEDIKNSHITGEILCTECGAILFQPNKFDIVT
jgi:hypothetical protein